MEFLKTNKNAQWVVPIIAGVFSCVCSCAVMFCIFSTLVMPMSSTGMTPEQAFQYGLQRGQQANTGQQLYTLAMYCIPPLLLVLIGLGTFFAVRSYQGRNAPPAPPMPPSGMA